MISKVSVSLEDHTNYHFPSVVGIGLESTDPIHLKGKAATRFFLPTLVLKKKKKKKYWKQDTSSSLKTVIHDFFRPNTRSKNVRDLRLKSRISRHKTWNDSRTLLTSSDADTSMNGQPKSIANRRPRQRDKTEGLYSYYDFVVILAL